MLLKDSTTVDVCGNLHPTVLSDTGAALLVCQDHMQLWHEQSHRYRRELRDFQKQTAETVEGLRGEHSTLSKDLEGAAVRVDRVEREMDHVEAGMSPRACVNKADKVVEQGAWVLEESRGVEEQEDWEELSSSVSGELQGRTHTF